MQLAHLSLALLLLVAVPGATAPPVGPEGGFTPESYASARAREYLAYATSQQTSSVLNAIAHMERDDVDPNYLAPADTIDVADWDARFRKLETLQDTRDFDGLYLLNALLGYEDHPYLTPATWDRTREVLQSFKYWVTDPTPPQPDPADPNRFWDESIYWTENHQALYHTIEFLMGQEYPNDCFTIVGFTPTGSCSGDFEMTGEDHRLRAREFLLRWFDERWEIGFVEWHSRIYYQKDATPLLTLIEYADDEEIRTRAEVILDILLLDMATHTHHDVLGATAGRSEMKDTYSGPVNDTWGITHLLFGQQDAVGYASTGDPGATLFARAKKYRLPYVILEAAHEPGPFSDRMRMSVPLDPSALVATPPPGHPFSLDEPGFTFWWGLGAWSTWQVVPITFWGVEEYALSETEFFEPFKPLIEIVGDPPDIEFAQVLARILAPIISVGLLAEVNTYSWRTPEYLLSTAQDHRKGFNSAQIQTWQLTFDTNAMVFTTHPGPDVQPPSEWIGKTDGQPGYWTGTASLPRSAQHENVAIHLYEPSYDPDGFDGSFAYVEKTHAYFPQDYFDEVTEQDGWTFGRVGKGYVALYSWRPTYWESYDPNELALLPPSASGPITSSFDLVAPGGADNVWIVEVSSEAESGSFVAFQGAVLGARLEVTDLGGSSGFAVRYRSPSQGLLAFDWDGPLTLDGREIPLDSYPRVANPWVYAEREDPSWVVQGADAGVDLAWDPPSRVVYAPEPPVATLGVLGLIGLVLRSAATSAPSRRTSPRPSRP